MATSTDAEDTIRAGTTPRRRAVALARKLREREGLTIAQIAARMGLSPATIAAYFSDPTGAKRDRSKQRRKGKCERCGQATSPDAHVKLCQRCWREHPARRWSKQTILDAMLAWHDAYNRLPTSYDWNRTAAKRRPDALRRLRHGDWPSASTVTENFGSWPAATRDALRLLAKRR